MSEPRTTEPVIDLAALALPPEWMRDALCAQIDHDGFFPEGKGSSNHAIKKTCAMCPVRKQCLDFAVANDEPHGIWGGTGPRERRPLRRAYRAAHPRVCEDERCDVLVDQTKQRKRFCSDECASRAGKRNANRKDSAA